MLQTFAYIKPKSLEEVLTLLKDRGEQKMELMAGGTDLIPAMRAKNKLVDCVLDVSDLNLKQIEIDQNNEISIGALVSFRELGRNETIIQLLPALAAAANKVGAVQTKSLATIGGNLCSAVPALDSAPPLLALAAKVRLVSQRGMRLVPIEEFFLGPRRTVLGRDELLTDIVIPVPEDGFKVSFIKVGRRKALTLSIVNGAAGLSLNVDGTIAEARIALGAVAPTPLRIKEAEKLLVGSNPSEALFAEAAALSMNSIKPINDLRASAEYRRLLAEVVVRRTLFDALKQIRTCS